MAAHRISRHGHFPQQYNYQDAERDSVRLPTRPNIGLALGLVVAMVSLVSLIVYYVL